MVAPEEAGIDPKELREVEIFEGLNESQVSDLARLGRRRSLEAGEYLFLLGESADRLFVVLSGELELCFPLRLGESIQDVCVEPRKPGTALGWSALVKPYRFTLSARSRGPSRVVGFLRQDLQKLFQDAPEVGCGIMRRTAEVIGHRLLKIQALWARELQRAVSERLSKP